MRRVTLHTEAVEAAVGVDAALGAGVGASALVDVHARLPIMLQSESGVAAALRTNTEREKVSSDAEQPCARTATP